MAEHTITSPANPRLKALVALRRRRRREETGRTLLEGYDELALALDAGVHPHELFTCDDLMADPAAQADVVRRAREAGAEVIRLSRQAFEKVAYREGADGFLAVVPAVGVTPRELALPDRPLVLIAEGVEKPGNLGAMLRTADAAGVDAAVAAAPMTDWGNPNVVRSSKGTVFSVPVATATTEETFGWARERGIRVVAATPAATSLHTDVDLTGPVAIAVGTEKEGLTDTALDLADIHIRIPMSGKANSLNVATSAAIILYEAVRQR
ncbi:rRNA methyltransferase [Flexivirga endophytica]|uniref:rRNA methyltransferase n=1 Tax=Flexivirga endophytica TaxID=1849103 RepID=A0A916T445_9MICO|nr:RNA methyltransferase [Flexivirga endophytica]GGB30847.1 rRNA methyltransferase [Flexivirga endophytica]GHB51766.1 rRNA methyltransferase [Flexivirga endophytica]